MPKTSPLLAHLLFACLLCTGSLSAETIYVNNQSGSDLNSGKSPENTGNGSGPLRSLTGALKRVERGDSISLANTGNPYKECVTVQGSRHTGTSFAPFVIDGNGATLDGSEEVPAHRWEHVSGDIFRFSPERPGYQQLFLSGRVAKQLPTNNWTHRTNSLPKEHWCRCNGGINFATEKGKSVHNYDLSYASHRVGITLYDVENVVIHDLRIRGFQLDGVNAHDNAFDCILSEVSSTANGRSGVSVGGASRIRLVKCRLRDNAHTQLHTEGWSTTNLHDSHMVDDDAPIWERELNNFGRGPRIIVDGVEQTDAFGWNKKEDEEEKELIDGLDQLDQESADAEMDEATELIAEAEEDAVDELNDEESSGVVDSTNDVGDVFGADEPDTDDNDAEGDLFDDAGDLFDDAGDEADELMDEDDPFGDL